MRNLSKYIDSQSGIADARLRRGIAIWALIGHLHAVKDPAIVAEDYEITADEVAAALEFYKRHREIIDDRLAANVG